MPKYTAFKDIKREEPPARPIEQRITDYNEVEQLLPLSTLKQQAERCMDCGIPFCNSYGCPVKNRIPDWNALVHQGHWERALELLHSTNNFPEITGRICPMPCEAACTLSINQDATTIKQIELQIIEHGWKNGWVKPEPAEFKTGKKIAIIGSGPAGLAAAQQLARLGHEVVVFEKSDRIGGILRYGIPDFKFEKQILDRRIEQMKQEGIIFEPEVKAGTDISVRYMKRTFDAIVITVGSSYQRDLKIPGRELNGIHLAMDYLIQQSKRIAGDKIFLDKEITARDKDVVIIGGGDTGSDCVGTARRQGAQNITQIEILPEPPLERDSTNPWPTFPKVLKTSSSHEEGCFRLWSVLTTQFEGKNNNVEKLNCVKINWSEPDKNGQRQFHKIINSEFEIHANLVILALGFIHVEFSQLVIDLDLKRDENNNIWVEGNLQTSVPGVFAAGDCVTGASLVAKAIYQGRQVAEGVDEYLSQK
jgi:glutamate synthase (NADPH) small chain